MTVVQNTELNPAGAPAEGVLVEVVPNYPAATANDSGSVIAKATTISDANGSWSLDLIPNREGLNPGWAWYVVTRTYPPNIGPKREVHYIVVPDSDTPVSFSTLVVSSPTAVPPNETEMSYHVAHPDPHPQYLTQQEADTRYDPLGSGGSGNATPNGDPLTHDEIIDWDETLANTSISDLSSATDDIALGSHKLVGLTAGDADTDGVNVGQLKARTPQFYVLPTSTPPAGDIADGSIWVVTSGTSAPTLKVRVSGAWSS